MKTSLHHILLGGALGMLAAIPSHMTAQTAAPAPAAGGAGQTTTSGNRNTTTTGTQNRASGTATTQRPDTGTATTNQNPAVGTGTTTTNQNPTAGTTTTTTNQNPTAGRNATTTTNQGGVATTPGNAAALPSGTTSFAGTIDSFGANNFSLLPGTGGTAADFLVGESTVFRDHAGNSVPRERFFQRGSRVPATVFFSRGANGSLMASRVVLNESIANAPIESAGTITEVSPGILVIEQASASPTPVRYVNNKTTNYVNEDGEPVAPESVKAGTPVKIFYTKVGDTLVASRVELNRPEKAGLPKPPVSSQLEQSTTTTTKTVKESNK